jgi:hypothetical protein
VRRELQKTNKAAAKENAAAVEDKAEDFVAEGRQPLRLLEFPKGFLQTLTGPPRHIGRGTMARLDRRIERLKASGLPPVG